MSSDALSQKTVFRSAEDLKRISEQWRVDKAAIDEKLGRIYQRDLDHELPNRARADRQGL